MKIDAVLGYIFNLLVFIILTILFVPAFFIVTYTQEYWAKKMSELFGL